jgi:hypothetical protein
MSANQYEGFIRIVAPTAAKAREIAVVAMRVPPSAIGRIEDAGASGTPGCREFRVYPI